MLGDTANNKLTARNKRTTDGILSCNTANVDCVGFDNKTIYSSLP